MDDLPMPQTIGDMLAFIVISFAFPTIVAIVVIPLLWLIASI